MNKKTAAVQLGLLLLFLLASSESVLAKGTPIGDIMLRGRVERSGQKLINNTSLFEGDSIRTLERSGGIVRIGRGRVEIDQLSEVEIVRENPLKIVVKKGRVDFSFPPGTKFEIITPQLSVKPVGLKSYSGIVTATPQKEDRVISRSGQYSILERELHGDTNTIHEGQVLVAALVATALPQAGARTSVATITALEPANAQVNIGRAANPKDTSLRATLGVGLFSGDVVQSLQGKAAITFTGDKSVITLQPGTRVTVREEMQPTGGLLRTISQELGSLWFSITKTRDGGTPTKLETPTAVAAIRGTEGQQDIDLAITGSTTFSLTEGEEELTELVTGSKVTIRSGQTVTAIRGVGFTVITAVAGLIAPSIAGTASPGGAGGAGGGGAGGGAGGAAGGGAGGGAGGAGGGGAGGAGGAGGGAAGAGAATATTTTVSAATSTLSSVVSIVATTVPAGLSTALATTLTENNDVVASPSQPPPANLPGTGPGET